MGALRWNGREKILFFIVIPMILVLIYLLPTNIKDTYFILNKQMPFILNAFLSNYTHSDFWHLIANMGSYIIVIYLLLKFETSKANFYKTVAFLFLIVPFIVSLVTVLYMPTIFSQGFSGVVAGLMGYFMYVTYRHIKDTWKLHADINFIYLMLCANAMVGAGSYWLTNNPLFMALLLFLTIGLAYYNRHLLRNIAILLKNKTRELKTKRVTLIANYVTLTLALAVLFSLPSLIQITIQNGGLANVMGHYAGYLAGIFFPLIAIEPKMPK